MINNNMLQGLAQAIIGSSITMPAAMAFGSTSAVLTSGDVATSGEFYRAALTTKTTSGNIAQFSLLKTSVTATSSPINCVGLWNSTSGGSLWCNMLMASIVQTTAFDIDTEIWIQFSGN